MWPDLKEVITNWERNPILKKLFATAERNLILKVVATSERRNLILKKFLLLQNVTWSWNWWTSFYPWCSTDLIPDPLEEDPRGWRGAV